MVGTFSVEQRRLFQNGLLHIAHVHGRPGQYTIRQVVQDEPRRAVARQRIRDMQVKAQLKVREDEVEAGYNNVLGVLGALALFALLLAFLFAPRLRLILFMLLAAMGVAFVRALISRGDDANRRG